MFSNFVFVFVFFENLALCEIMWKNAVEPYRLDDDVALVHCMLDN